MTTSKAIRIFGGLSLVLAVAVYFFAAVVAGAALRPVDQYSGWTLLAIIAVLALLNARKKLSMIPLGTAFLWLQVHLVLGFVSIVVFLSHMGWSVPRGPLEYALAIVFVLVAVTGCVGLVQSRLLAPRLRQRGDEVIFERIPGFARSLRRRAERLVVESAAEGAAPTIADFYRVKLASFFARPGYSVGHLVGSSRSAYRLLEELRSLDRYLNEAERSIQTELVRLIRKKDDLDFQFSAQATLKYWLFLHIPLTYVLLLLVTLHVVVVHAFSGGLP